MKYTNIGGIECSRLALGCMRIADKPIQNIERLVSTALELGINTFDHADIYGGGSCETLFATAVKNLGVPRDKLVLQTKCGIRGGWYDLSAEHITESVNASLKRLNTDYIDILLLHRPDTLMRPDKIAKAFDALIDSGKVRAVGVSNFSAGQIDFLQSATEHKLCANQMQMSPTYCPMIDSGLNVNTASHAACDRDGGALEYCRKNNITIQTYGTVQCSFTDETGYCYSGALFTDTAKKKYFALNYMLEGLAQKYGVTAESVAIAWTLHHPAEMQAIVGTTHAGRLSAYRDCCDVPLTDYEWYKIYQSAGHELP